MSQESNENAATKLPRDGGVEVFNRVCLTNKAVSDPERQDIKPHLHNPTPTCIKGINGLQVIFMVTYIIMELEGFGLDPFF